jgi:hypothetical protein
MATCLAEDCANWTGFGCVCAFLDLEPIDVRATEESTS